MSADLTTIDDTARPGSWSRLRGIAPVVEPGPSGPAWLPRALGPRAVIAMLALIAIVLFFRKPEALLMPQFIADDALLFRDAWADGVRSILQPYAGYTLVAPRLIAWLGVVTTPVASMPAFYAAASLASMLFTCARLMSSRVTLDYAWIAALVVPLIPHDGEVYLNLCYIQWSLILAAFALLVTRPAAGAREWTGDIATLAVVGLSGPFILPLAPFFVAAALRDRSRHSTTMAVIAVVTSLAQVASLVATGALSSGVAAGTIVHDGLLAAGTKLVAVTFLGRLIPYDLPPIATATLGLALGVAAVVAIAGLAWRGHRLLVAAMIAAILFYVASAFVRVREKPLDLIPFDHGDRYFYVPRILLVWSLLLALATRWRRLAAALLLLAALSAATTFRTDRPQHYDWRRWSGAIERGEPTWILVSPYDWRVEIPGRKR